MTTSLKQWVKAEKAYTKQVPVRGNGIFAVHDIAPKSEVIFVTRPLMVALETPQLQTRCYYCYSSPGDPSQSAENAKGQTLKTCGGCKAVKFCGQKCQTRAWLEYHRLECKLYGRLHPRILPSTARAIIRLLKQHKAQLLSQSEWDQLLTLESHQEDLIKAGGQRWQDIFIMMKGIKSYCGTNHSEETVLRISCILLVNSFTLTNPTFDSLGLILHPKPALLNHSCDPNAFVRFDVPAVGHQEDFPPYGNISVHALKPIARDEEVTLSYIDTTFPFDKRQEELKARFHPSLNTVATDAAQPAISAIVAETGDQVEQFFAGLQSQTGLEHTQIDSINHIMHRLAQTSSWPLYRYPWPQLRQQLLLGLLASQRYSEALLHSAVFVRIVHPVMFEQEHHPIRVVQMWTFWNLCRQCLESLMLHERSLDSIQHDPQMLGMLSCVLIDDIHRIMNRGTRSDGKLEKLIDGALQDVKNEGSFWNAYQHKKAETRKIALAWIDNQLKALLRKEDVSQDIIDLAFKPQG
ncbi:SET domain-containing protein [Cladophialophora immunda]|nr:SET domain-containing protein [Cladophialophora immunda]